MNTSVESVSLNSLVLCTSVLLEKLNDRLFICISSYRPYWCQTILVKHTLSLGRWLFISLTGECSSCHSTFLFLTIISLLGDRDGGVEGIVAIAKSFNLSLMKACSTAVKLFLDNTSPPLVQEKCQARRSSLSRSETSPPSVMKNVACLLAYCCGI